MYMTCVLFFPQPNIFKGKQVSFFKKKVKIWNIKQMLLTTFRKNMFPPKMLPKNKIKHTFSLQKTHVSYEKEKLLAVS